MSTDVLLSGHELRDKCKYTKAITICRVLHNTHNIKTFRVYIKGYDNIMRKETCTYIYFGLSCFDGVIG